MRKFSVFFLLIIVIISCKKESDLSKKFDCNYKVLSNLKTYSDFKNNFKLNVPATWKTTKYYSDVQSEIFTADTLKQLTETYILKTSYALGSFNFDTDFYQKTDSIIHQNNLKTIKSGTTTFIELPTFWYVVKGEKNGFSYHQFNLISKKGDLAYFTASVEIYGDLNVDERICESIALLEKIEFLQ
jgi:hypothetical protein